MKDGVWGEKEPAADAGLTVLFPVFPRRGRRVHSSRPRGCARFLSGAHTSLPRWQTASANACCHLFVGIWERVVGGKTKQYKHCPQLKGLPPQKVTRRSAVQKFTSVVTQGH